MQSPGKLFRCPIPKCDWTSLIKIQYVQHVERMHDPLHGFKCINKHCNLTFTSVKTLRKHLSICPDEDFPENVNITNIASQSINESLVLDISLVPTPGSSSINPTLSNSPEYLEEKNNYAKLAIESIKKSMYMKRLSNMLKWLSQDGLPRKVATDMEKDVVINVVEPFIEAIDLLNSLGMMSDSCKDTLQNLAHIHDYTSEYKCIKELKDNDLFTDPIVFSINDEFENGIIDLSSDEQVYSVIKNYYTNIN